MDCITGIQRAIDYIEAHLTEQIDYEAVAAECYSSSYNFQRIFSILCGYTLGEYIRNRRMSLAGAELASTDLKVIDAALKYGYDSPDSFSKAFKSFHGILPSQARGNGSNLRSFSRLVVKLFLEGGKIMNYQIEKGPRITVTGHRKRFTGDFEKRFEEQHDFMVDGGIRFIRYALQGAACDCSTEYCVVSDTNDEGYSLTVGTVLPEYFNNHLKKTFGEYEELLTVITIPERLYLKAESKRGVFYMESFRELYGEIINEWLPDSCYEIANAPEISVIHKFNNDKDSSYVELWLPIEKK